MSKRNSREAKRLRREKNLYRQERFSNPIPKPDDYIQHYGYVPDIPFFANSAVAANRPDMRLALRTKEQLIDYVENNPEHKILNTKTGGSVVRVSFFYCAGDDEIERDGIGGVAWRPKDNLRDGRWYHPEEKEDKRQLYVVRGFVRQGTLHSDNSWERDTPFHNAINTFFVDVEDLEKLPEKRFTKEELIYFAKKDESTQPFDDEELDTFFANHKESYLRENYVYNEHGLVIDEFDGEDGLTYYQPKKKDRTWELSSFNAPFIQTRNGFSILLNELFDEKKVRENAKYSH